MIERRVIALLALERCRLGEGVFDPAAFGQKAEMGELVLQLARAALEGARREGNGQIARLQRIGDPRQTQPWRLG